MKRDAAGYLLDLAIRRGDVMAHFSESRPVCVLARRERVVAEVEEAVLESTEESDDEDSRDDEEDACSVGGSLRGLSGLVKGYVTAR